MPGTRRVGSCGGTNGWVVGQLIGIKYYEQWRTAPRGPRLTVACIGEVVWFVMMVVFPADCWFATTGGQWVAAMLSLVADLLLSTLFLAPSSRVAPFPLVGIEILALVVGASGLFHIPRRDRGFTKSGPWFAAAIVLGVIAARFMTTRLGVRNPTVTTLSFPLGAGRWMIVEGEERLWNHHWAVVEQRAALDIVKVSRWRRTRKGWGNSGNSSYLAFGSVVYSPCDGIVVAVTNRFDDHELSLKSSGGNGISIDTGHELVVLSHLRNGSVAVQLGQTVQAGEILAEIGNSGNSCEPHLHIHAEVDGQPRRIVFQGISSRLVRGKTIFCPEY
jgi:hypothetical protein